MSQSANFHCNGFILTRMLFSLAIASQKGPGESTKGRREETEGFRQDPKESRQETRGGKSQVAKGTRED